jgi:c-di-GMP-binding flagellar brake protein YcgR
MSYKPVLLHESDATTSTASRRVWARYSSSRPLPRRLTVADTNAPLEAWILDLSAGGIGLLVMEYQEPGLQLQIELETCPQAAPLKLLAKVVYCKPADEDRREHRLGCRFVNPLSECDLQALLQ